MNAVLVRNANRMMTVAGPRDDGIEVSFADGCRGLIPFAVIPEVEGGASLSSIELPNPYEMILETAGGDRIEVPWDFARHYCDESYRPMVEAIAMQGRQTLGQRIRRLRKAEGFTQETLASAADVSRVTLVRLESGEQTPRYSTLSAIAGALGRNVQELLVDSELLPSSAP